MYTRATRPLYTHIRKTTVGGIIGRRVDDAKRGYAFFFRHCNKSTDNMCTRNSRPMTQSPRARRPYIRKCTVSSEQQSSVCLGTRGGSAERGCKRAMTARQGQHHRQTTMYFLSAVRAGHEKVRDGFVYRGVCANKSMFSSELLRPKYVATCTPAHYQFQI